MVDVDLFVRGVVVLKVWYGSRPVPDFLFHTHTTPPPLLNLLFLQCFMGYFR